MRVIFVIAVLAIMSASAPASAQLLSERNISLQAARALADASIACARKDGYDVSVVVVDRSGNVKVMMKGDLANPHNPELAYKKAYTARTYGVTTMEFRNRTRGTELEGQRDLTDIIPLGGGVPIIINNERVGGLGLSGAPTQEADDKCAHEALKSAAAQLK